MRSRDLIERLGLSPHPEGGWYRETWRAPAGEGERAAATAIHFLLESGQSSHWHTVDAHEIWLWHGGDPLILSLAESDAGPIREITLGLAKEGHAVQAVVLAGEWQAARATGGSAGYSLVSCIVAPGFDFGGFRLAPAAWAPGA